MNAHPVVRTHPETNRKLAVRERQLHQALRGLDGARQRAAPRAPVRRDRSVRVHLPAPLAARRPAGLGQPLRAARRGRRHRRTRNGPCTARRSPGTPPTMTDIPWIVSLDDHVVEPPDIWTQPAAGEYRDTGPRIVMAPPGQPVLHRRHLPGGAGDRGRTVAWWFYEDQKYSVKRLIAAAGYPADEITFQGITFDQMRPGCWRPAARLEDMTVNHVEASLCFPTTRGSAARSSSTPPTRTSRSCASRPTTTGMVDEWAGPSGRPARPALPDPAVGPAARRRRGAPQRGPGRARRLLLGAARVARPAEHPLRALGPVVRGVLGDRHRASRCTSAREPRR